MRSGFNARPQLPPINTQVGGGRPVIQPPRPLNPDAPAFRPAGFQPNPRPMNPNASPFEPGAANRPMNPRPMRADARPFHPPEPLNYRPQAPVAPPPAHRPFNVQQQASASSASSYAPSPGGAAPMLPNAPLMHSRRDHDLQGPTMNAFRPTSLGLDIPTSPFTPQGGPSRPLPPADFGYTARPNTTPLSPVPQETVRQAARPRLTPRRLPFPKATHRTWAIGTRDLMRLHIRRKPSEHPSRRTPSS
jgi:hypothetical protein